MTTWPAYLNKLYYHILAINIGLTINYVVFNIKRLILYERVVFQSFNKTPHLVLRKLKQTRSVSQGNCTLYQGQSYTRG